MAVNFFFLFLLLFNSCFRNFLQRFLYIQFPFFWKVKFLTDEIYHWTYFLWDYVHSEKFNVLFYYFWFTFSLYGKYVNIPFPVIYIYIFFLLPRHLDLCEICNILVFFKMYYYFIWYIPTLYRFLWLTKTDDN